MTSLEQVLCARNHEEADRVAPGGGYVLVPVHCIQPDVPPENLIAMFDEAVVAGKYSLHT